MSATASVVASIFVRNASIRRVRWSGDRRSGTLNGVPRGLDNLLRLLAIGVLNQEAALLADVVFAR